MKIFSMRLSSPKIINYKVYPNVKTAKCHFYQWIDLLS